MVPMIEVLLPEEHRRRVVAAHHLGSQAPHPFDEHTPEGIRIVKLAVGIPEVGHTGETDHGRGLFDFGGAGRHQPLGSDLGIECPLAPVRADHEVNGRSPALAQRANVPPHATSASSGWA